MTNEDRLKKIICELLSVEEDQITAGTKIQEDLGADSLDVVELVMDVENEFDLEIPDECAEKFFTFKDVLEYIDAKAPKLVTRREP